jgi:hypothetical protein
MASFPPLPPGNPEEISMSWISQTFWNVPAPLVAWAADIA